MLEYFNNLQNTSEDKKLMFDDGTNTGGEFSNIKNARILKPKKNICAECNSARSTESDSYFDRFIIDAFNWQKNISEIQSIVSPPNDVILKEAAHQKTNIVNSIRNTFWDEMNIYVFSKYYLTTKYHLHTHAYNELLIKKYLAKHTVCYLDRSGIEPPTKLRNVFLHGENLDVINFKIYFLPTDFQHGYLNTLLKMPDYGYAYALIFSNLAIHVEVKKE